MDLSWFLNKETQFLFAVFPDSYSSQIVDSRTGDVYVFRESTSKII